MQHISHRSGNQNAGRKIDAGRQGSKNKHETIQNSGKLSERDGPSLRQKKNICCRRELEILLLVEFQFWGWFVYIKKSDGFKVLGFWVFFVTVVIPKIDRTYEKYELHRRQCILIFFLFHQGCRPSIRKPMAICFLIQESNYKQHNTQINI